MDFKKIIKESYMDFLFPQSIESKDFFSLNKFSNKNYLPDDIYAEKFISLLEEPINCPINNKNILNPGTVINNNETQKSSKLTSFKRDSDGKYLCPYCTSSYIHVTGVYKHIEKHKNPEGKLCICGKKVIDFNKHIKICKVWNNKIPNLCCSNLFETKITEKCDDKDDFYISTKKIFIKDMYIIPYYAKNFFSVNDNIINAKQMNGKNLYYIFYDDKYRIHKRDSKAHKFKIILLENILTLSIGICDKKIVVSNNYKFNIQKNQKRRFKNNGTYIINTNGFSWNCNNQSQCKSFCLNEFTKGSEIELSINPIECEMEYKLNGKFLFKFNDVRCIKDKYLTPCLIFYHNCSLKTIFYYN